MTNTGGRFPWDHIWSRYCFCSFNFHPKNDSMMITNVARLNLMKNEHLCLSVWLSVCLSVYRMPIHVKNANIDNIGWSLDSLFFYKCCGTQQGWSNFKALYLGHARWCPYSTQSQTAFGVTLYPGRNNVASVSDRHNPDQIPEERPTSLLYYLLW